MLIPPVPNAVRDTALAALRAGISVVPIRPDGSKQPNLSRWRVYREALPYSQDLMRWFADPEVGLALVTGPVSADGLIAFDFDSPGVFAAWREYVLADPTLCRIYNFIAEGYEERTPKGGRHLLFCCPEAFADGEQKPRDQKLALRPVPPPQRFETLAEIKAGGLIIVYPSHGSVHPTGRPYYLLRGRVDQIRKIPAKEYRLLRESVQRFDEVPKDQPRPEARISRFSPGFPQTAVGERPGDLFASDPGVTWEALLTGGWHISEPVRNSAGYPERYLRHPGKVGKNPSCTLNADGTDRLYCFSPSVGLPLEQYLNKFQFYAHWHWGGNFRSAVRALVAMGYTKREPSVPTQLEKRSGKI